MKRGCRCLVRQQAITFLPHLDKGGFPRSPDRRWMEASILLAVTVLPPRDSEWRGQLARELASSGRASRSCGQSLIVRRRSTACAGRSSVSLPT
jgi:hypothetical protein